MMRGSTTEEFESFLATHKQIRQSTTFVEGELIGEWRITAFLGKGGSGEVYRAERPTPETGTSGTDGTTGTEVAALKVLAKDDDAARTRFQREIELLSKNWHTAFPRFYGAGEVGPSRSADHRDIKGDTPYYTMELLSPVELPSADAVVAKYILAVSQAVAILHRSGLVHRDIKPQNIMRRANGDLVLIDLGLVKKLSAPDSLPGTSATLADGRMAGVGTPRYAAPEQFNGGAVSPTADIHALGMLANECFGGRPPRAWERIISRSTSSIPERRYGDIDAFTQAIRHRHDGRLATWCGGLIALLAVAALLSLTDGISVPLQRSPVIIESNRHDPSDDALASGDVADLRRRLAEAKPGETVWVKPGRYEGSLSVETNGLKIVAISSDPRKTVIVGEKLKSVISIGKRCDGLLLRGFTLTGGTGTGQPSVSGKDYYGGGICTKSSITVENCIIKDNGKGEARVNAATFGGGVWAFSNVTLHLVNCLVADNFAWACGGAIGAGEGGSRIEIERCTIVDNRSTSFFGLQGGIGLTRGSCCSVRDSVVWGNQGDQIGAFSGQYSLDTEAIVSNCVVEGGASSGGIRKFSHDGCRAIDPGFFDRDAYLPTAVSDLRIGFRIPQNQ